MTLKGSTSFKLADHFSSLISGGGCLGKKAFYTREEAQVERRRMIDATRGTERAADPAWFIEYRCGRCGHYHLGHDKREQKRMSDSNAREHLRSGGGVVTLLLGMGYDVPSDYAHHPQVHGVAANGIKRGAEAAAIPSNTRAIIVTDRIDQQTYNRLKDAMRHRGLVYISRRNQEAIGHTLADLLPKNAPKPKPEPAATNNGGERTIAGRGVIKALANEADLSKPTVEEARRLFAVAKSRGIISTLASVEQSIRARRKAEQSEADIAVAAMTLDMPAVKVEPVRNGVTDNVVAAVAAGIPAVVIRPASAPPSGNETLLAEFDATVVALQELGNRVVRLRETIERTSKRNETLEARLALLKETLEV